MDRGKRKDRAAARSQRRQTSAILLSRGQIVLGLLTLAVVIALGQRIGWYHVLQGIVAAITVFFCLSVGLKFVLRAAATRYRFPKLDLPGKDDEDLPSYSVLIALRGEEDSVGRLVRALARLEYAVEKLEILLLVDADDVATQMAIESIKDKPEHISMSLVPNVGPRNKPKALNWGWMHSNGDLISVYDAEDRMDIRQLLKAAARFAQLAATDPKVACLQAQLIFWNPRPKLVSTMYFAEYIVHFTWVLKGLARLGLVPPLGGTSNHFRNDALRAVAKRRGANTFYDSDNKPVVIEGPWDPFNVTEDAMLAMDLAVNGYKTGMLPSFTYEEAPVKIRKCVDQRSRWLKGYIQTFLVHCRKPFWRIRRVGLLSWATFELLMISAPLSLLLLPITWGVTAIYIFARWVVPLPSVTHYIYGLFPSPVFYAAIVVAGVGNCELFIQKLSAVAYYQEYAEISTDDVGALGAGLKTQMYGLVPRLLFTFIWWAFTSISAYKAASELPRRSTRAKWALSKHGHEGVLEDRLETEAANRGLPQSKEVEP